MAHFLCCKGLLFLPDSSSEDTKVVETTWILPKQIFLANSKLNLDSTNLSVFDLFLTSSSSAVHQVILLGLAGKLLVDGPCPDDEGHSLQIMGIVKSLCNFTK